MITKAFTYFLLLLLMPCAVNAQMVSGRVYDEQHLPLEGAVVYFDGTSNSTSTDSEGQFIIRGNNQLPAVLVVSFVGFRSVRVDNPYSGNKLEIILTPDAIEMEAAVVTGTTVFTRKEMLKAFKKQFLGTSGAGASCKIENEDDIRLRYDISNNTLYAEAVRPLRIVNEKLKYVVTFDLVASEVRYKKKTLDSDYISGAFFGGTTFFTDVAAGDEAAKQRADAYMGSPMHFIKTAVTGDWEAQKFKLFRGSLGVDPAKYFTVSDTLGLKKVNILDVASTNSMSLHNDAKKRRNSSKRRFEILYNKKVQSFVLYNYGSFYADTNGSFWPLNELTFGGYMGNLRVGDMLPADYRPN